MLSPNYVFPGPFKESAEALPNGLAVAVAISELLLATEKIAQEALENKEFDKTFAQPYDNSVLGE